MRKVVFVINSLTGGGAERIMARLLSHSGNRTDAAELHLVLLDDEPIAYEIPASVHIHQLDAKGSMLNAAIPFWRLVGALKPDICVSFLTRSNLLAIATCRLRGIRCVISERVNTSSHHPKSFGGNLARLATRLFYPLADRTIAVSAGIAEDLTKNYGVPAEKISIIANPIDGDFIRGRSAEVAQIDYPRPLVVGMGRLVPNKNFSLLVDAYARWGGKGTLLIMGEGPLRRELEAQIAQLGLEQQIVLLGFQTNPFSAIAAADCYVLPSNGEGFPNGLVEAMILGTPVISTNCHSGPAEILDDRSYFEVDGVTQCKYGLLVPTNDAVALAEALAVALAPGQRQSMSARALEGTARYGLEATIDRYWGAIDGTEV